MRLIHLSNQNALFLIWTGKLSRLNSVRNESSAVFNTPKLSQGGKITSTAKWSYKTMDEFWAFFNALFPIWGESRFEPLLQLIQVQTITVLCSNTSSISISSWFRKFVLNCRNHGNIISKTIKVKTCRTVKLEFVRKSGSFIDPYGEQSVMKKYCSLPPVVS